MITRRDALVGAAVTTAVMTAVPAWAAAEPELERVKVDVVAPPFVHAHEQATTQKPKIVEFRLVVEEKEIVIDEKGTKFRAMTYNGSIPGPMMVVHQGDYLELTLVNPDTNTMPHNIDFHAATGALGGAGLTLINPGEQVVLRFKATRPGVFVYHCAPGSDMTPWHVVSGMNGAVMVLPRAGLTDGRRQAAALRPHLLRRRERLLCAARRRRQVQDLRSRRANAFPDTIEVMRKLIPTHVVFEGRVGALTGKNAMTAKVGETVLIVHSQANRDTRPHLIGGHGDHVWETGKFSNAPQTDLETWFVRGGSAAAALYTFRQPGIYAYVNHNLIEAVELGATAHFKVEGKWNDDLMTQIKAPGPIPETNTQGFLTPATPGHPVN